MKRIRFEVTGRVTGVYFRVHAVQKAKSLGVTGWIRNTEHHNVEGEAQQEKPKLDEFIHWLKYEGSPDSKIDQCKIQEIPPIEGETEFKKRRWGT